MPSARKGNLGTALVNPTVYKGIPPVRARELDFMGDGPNAGPGMLEEANVIEKRNGMCYAAALANPFTHQGARLPSDGNPGTAIARTLQTIDLDWETCTEGYGYDYGAIVVQPTLLDNYWRTGEPTGHLSNITWTDYNSSHYTTIAAMALMYRVTSLGVRIRTSGAIGERGCKIRVHHFNRGVNSGTTPPADLYQDMIDSCDFQEFDSAKMPIDGIELSWAPLTLEPVVVNATNALTTGSGMRFCSNNTCLDSAIAVFIATPTPVGVSDMITIDIVMNIEYIPLMEDATIPVARAPGSLKDVGTGLTAEAIAFEAGESKVPPPGIAHVPVSYKGPVMTSSDAIYAGKMAIVKKKGKSADFLKILKKPLLDVGKGILSGDPVGGAIRGLGSLVSGFGQFLLPGLGGGIFSGFGNCSQRIAFTGRQRKNYANTIALCAVYPSMAFLLDERNVWLCELSYAQHQAALREINSQKLTEYSDRSGTVRSLFMAVHEDLFKAFCPTTTEHVTVKRLPRERITDSVIISKFK